MYREADSESIGLVNHRLWWDVIDSFNLGSEWRMDLDQLSRQPAFEPRKDQTPKPGDLSFLIKEGTTQMAINLLPFFQHIIIKCGDRGVVTLFRISGEENVGKSTWVNERSNPLGRYIVARNSSGSDIIVLKHFPAIPLMEDEIINVTGAGDSLVGSLSASIVSDPTTFLHPEKLDNAVRLAQKAAVMSLHSVRAVSPLLGRADITV